MNTSKINRYSLKQYTRLMLSFFGCLLVLTLSQYGILYFNGILDNIFSTSLLKAIVHQLGFTAITGIILVFPFNFWENLRPKYGFHFVFVLLGCILIIEALLIGYYCTTLVPLGADLLAYSSADIKTFLAHSEGFMIAIYLLTGIIILIALFQGLYKITSHFYHRISKMYPFTIILFSLFLASVFTDGKAINQNKTQYLTIDLYTNSKENYTYTAKEEFPLLLKNSPENVLGEYFNLKKGKPNIVFIIVEGLGRDFVGEGAEYGGFTPFLDSLSTNSLYWENFLSNTGGTFGVLPSLLGSLPFGKSGFMNLEKFPNKLTLFSVLKNNGYHTSFYQGTHSSFDKVDRFLESERIDFLLDKSGFGNGYRQQGKNTSGSSWGYPDKELFKKSISLPRLENKARLEVYMTRSTREPFIPPNQDFYEFKVEKIRSTRNYDARVKSIIEKNDNVFASLLYTDDAINWFLNAYKTQPNYDNTIFLITGDHRLTPIPQRNNLSSFHVPLIIYSPMLKGPRKMSSVSSHFDVTPSILAMMSESHKLKMPGKVAWMGRSMDMETSFRSTKNIPLMRNKNELKEYVSGDKLYMDGDILELDAQMNVKSSFSGTSILTSKLEAFKSINYYVTTENKIIPDSLAIFTNQNERFTDSEMVWLNSVYNGKDSDKGYSKARGLAFDKKWDRALLLCRYILFRSPSHIDARILMGRINAWKGNHEDAIKILTECIDMNPNYFDSYAALFDVYFWSEQHRDGLELIALVEENNSGSKEIASKISRARNQARKANIKVHESRDHNIKANLAASKQ